MMIGMTIDLVENPAWALRTAALGALVFDVFYVVHRLLQGLGPDDATPGAFVALGFISQAAETALVGVADAGDQSAVLALNHLQGRIPIVWTITAFTVAIPLSPDCVRGYSPLGWVSRDSSPPACLRSARCPASSAGR
jgi:hypothetical protein